MKVIFISTCYPRKSSSHNGIFVHQQAKALTALGVECHIIQPVIWFPPLGLHRLHVYWRLGYKEQQDMYDEYEGIKIHHPKIFMKLPSRFFPEYYWTRMGRTIASYIKKKKELSDADILFSHFICNEGYAGVKVKELTGIPLAAIALGDDVHAWPAKDKNLVFYLREVFQHADILLANSKRLALDTKYWMLPDHKKEVHAIYNGVDYNKFSPAVNSEEKRKIREQFNLPKQDKLILCVARPVREKGWLELLDAIKELNNQLQGWKLVAVSPIGLEANEVDLYKEAQARNIQDKLILIDRLSPELLALLYKTVDVFILPSYNEGMCNAVLEAMASGLPVITTDVGGHSEVIRNSVNGILIPPQELKPLVEGFNMILSDEIKTKGMARNARNTMLEFGNYIDNGKKFVELFKKNIK